VSFEKTKDPADILNNHAHCLLCDDVHPRARGLSFEKTGPGGVKTKFVAGSELRGYDNVLQSGVITSLLDAAMPRDAQVITCILLTF
jgi:acyl-coenzyme A thioesterase PaaI-like protein